MKRETAAAATICLGLAAGLTARADVRFLVPQSTELGAVVQAYNRAHPDAPVEIIRRGDTFSCLKDLVAFHLAGDPPDLALIESSELPALDKLGLAKKIGAFAPQWPVQGHALPFEQTVPVLFVDQEMLFRTREKPDRLPTEWPELVRLAGRLAEHFEKDRSRAKDTPAGERYALALPLQGARGLWIFEALAGQPLWSREKGGLRTNRALKPAVEALQKLLDSPRTARHDESWDRAIQSFLDRQSPLLVASLDALPRIQKQATFRWAAAPLPAIPGGPSRLEGGSQLILTRDTPAARKFLAYLYSDEVAPKWISAGGFLPWRERWLFTPAWKSQTRGLETYAALSRKLKASAKRTTDPEVVRAHLAWAQALKSLFGEPQHRLSIEAVMTQLDRDLNPKY